MLNYIYAESTIKPASVEIQKTTVYLRKDFVEKGFIDELTGKTCSYWTYNEAIMTHEEFNKYASEQAAMNAVKGVNDSERIVSLIENGVNSTDNQLILMEALADLYELIASMTPEV